MELIQIAKEFGIPVAFLVFICGAIWKISSWLGENVVKPMTERHIKFVDKIENSILEQTKNLEALTKESAKVTEFNKQNAEEIKDVVTAVKDLQTAFSEVREVVINAGSVKIGPTKPA